MVFYTDERLALFIDGASLYSSARALNLEVDFRKLLREFRDRGRLLRASYYTTIVESDEYSPVRPLVDWLAYNGSLSTTAIWSPASGALSKPPKGVVLE